MTSEQGSGAKSEQRLSAKERCEISPSRRNVVLNITIRLASHRMPGEQGDNGFLLSAELRQSSRARSLARHPRSTVHWVTCALGGGARSAGRG